MNSAIDSSTLSLISTLLIILCVSVGAIGVGIIFLFRKKPNEDFEKIEGTLGDLKTKVDMTTSQIREEASLTRREQTERWVQQNQSETNQAKELRMEINQSVESLAKTTHLSLDQFSQNQKFQFESFNESNRRLFENLKTAVEEKLRDIQKDNNEKLESMRKTVEEKLEGTLEKRLSESFKQVSDRLEQVHKGLGEMQTLAIGVGDLKKVFSNIKTRGMWGEIQLGSILEQVLTPEQYSKNVQPKANSREVVEFAIKLPGSDSNSQVWLPIDSKFPIEDYQRLIQAQELGQIEMAATAAQELEGSIRKCAKDIRDKYISPPETTDFAILFLPTESLYAEALRRPGLSETLQRELRVTLAGPTTLGAILNSLQMGFRTLAIQKRSSEVWKVLGAVKTQFEQFGGILDGVQKKLQEANNVIEKASSKSRNIEMKLKKFESLPEHEAAQILKIDHLDL